MDTPHTSPPIGEIPLSDLVTVISDVTRWRILNELAKGEPLPVNEIARRIGVKPGNVSKHCNVLLYFEIVQRGYGSLYKIPERFLVPGERALDFGAALIRLDRVDRA